MNLRLIVLFVCCCGSFGLAALSGEANGTPTAAASLVDATTPTDVISALIAARAGGNVTRIGAGLNGDWSMLADDSDAFGQNTKPVGVTPVAKLPFNIVSSYAMPVADGRTPEAIAVPLPPALLASIPGVGLALLASRRMAAR